MSRRYSTPDARILGTGSSQILSYDDDDAFIDRTVAELGFGLTGSDHMRTPRSAASKQRKRDTQVPQIDAAPPISRFDLTFEPLIEPYVDSKSSSNVEAPTNENVEFSKDPPQRDTSWPLSPVSKPKDICLCVGGAENPDRIKQGYSRHMNPLKQNPIAKPSRLPKRIAQKSGSMPSSFTSINTSQRYEGPLGIVHRGNVPAIYETLSPPISVSDSVSASRDTDVKAKYWPERYMNPNCRPLSGGSLDGSKRALSNNSLSGEVKDAFIGSAVPAKRARAAEVMVQTNRKKGKGKKAI